MTEGDMPELPEVEVIRKTLSEHVCGKVISGITVLEPFILTASAKAELPKTVGRKVCRVNRWGKCLIMELAGGDAILIHLRMTGRLLWKREAAIPDAYTHLIFSFANESLVYRDVRKFGRIDVTGKKELNQSLIVRRFGPDVLTLSKKEFTTRIEKKKSQIKAVLLDQQNMAGLGNIYADEVLFDAGIHPRTEAARLTQARLGQLFESTRRILGEAIRLGGSSMRDYVHTDGEPGSFQNFHHVYQKAGRPCDRCEETIKSDRIAGRTSSFCPRCQKELKAA
jgi:formamidopyrimidine-DNA glycosylase